VAMQSGDANRSGNGAETPKLRRGLSAIYGAGASRHAEADLIEWLDVGTQAQEAARRQDWKAARALLERCVELRPEWRKGHECLTSAIAKERSAQQSPPQQAPQPLTQPQPTTAAAMRTQGHAHLGRDSQPDTAKKDSLPAGQTVVARASPAEQLAVARVSSDRRSSVRPSGARLLPHERDLLESGQLRDATHTGASAIWLRSESAALPLGDTHVAVYRPMGDPEVAHLLAHGVLPATQPYQTIVEGAAGRQYAERYLRGSKWVDSSPTTVVEFVCPRALVDRLFAWQCKPEEGCLSHGLGEKGGKGLPLFNESLQSGSTSFRLVLVKRPGGDRT